MIKYLLILLIILIMGSWGFRISEENVKVKTGDDVDMIVTSKYANLKGVISGNGSITFPASLSIQSTSVTIAHGLEYMPTARVSVHAIEAIASGEYVETPYIYGFFDRFYVYEHKLDATNLTISFKRQNDANVALTVAYKYFIYLDKGKV